MKEFFEKLGLLCRDYLKPFLISLVCVILALATGCGIYLAVFMNSGTEKYPKTVKVDIFGTVSKESPSDLVCGNSLTVDFGAIASSCGMTISGSGKELRVSSYDGSELAVFTDGSDFVSVNGMRIHMECQARIKGTNIYVPISFISLCTKGIDVSVAEDKSEIKVVKTDSVPSFAFRSPVELVQISDKGVPVEFNIDDSELNYEFKLNLDSYKKYLNPADAKSLLLYFGLSKRAEPTFVPADLVDSSNTKKGTSIKINLNASKALEAMIMEMEAEGIKDMYISRGYQSYEAQKKNWDVYVYNERYYYRYNFETTGKYFSDTAYEVLGKDYLNYNYISKGNYALTAADAEAVASSYCAAPGTGDHITGLGVDLHDKTGANLDFAKTDAYAWLKENAYKFGFIERFPEDREKMTGFHFEPYHWRFVGQYHAAVMHREGYCLEEYLSFLGLGG